MKAGVMPAFLLACTPTSFDNSLTRRNNSPLSGIFAALAGGCADTM